jgi:hypothetical protein
MGREDPVFNRHGAYRRVENLLIRTVRRQRNGGEEREGIVYSKYGKQYEYGGCCEGERRRWNEVVPALLAESGA